MQSPVNRWPRLLPSFPAGLALALLLLLVAQPWRTMMVASDGDPCMHWRVGEWMLQHGRVIRADVFSHTRAGQPIISKEWLAEILFALAGRAGGLFGLAVVAALVIAATFWLLFRQLLRAGGDLLVAALVMLLAVGASWTHWLARPHLFSFLLLVLWNGALREYEVTGRARRLALTLAALTVCWTNLHGAFLAGFMVLGAYGVGALLERRWQRLGVLSGVAALCVVASFANPNGWRLLVHNLGFLRSEFLLNYLKEYASPDFHGPAARGFLLWLAVIGGTLALVRPKLPVSAGVLLISWTWFALFSVRNIPLLVIVTAPILTAALTPAVPARWRELSARLRAASDAGHGWLWAVPVAVAMIAGAPRPTVMPASDWPVEAVEYIQHYPGKLPGHLFNAYPWGGYLMWALPAHPVFVDGRTDFYGAELIREFRDTMALSAGFSMSVAGAQVDNAAVRDATVQQAKWQRMLDKYQVGWTLLPTAHPLNQALALLPNWVCIKRDDVATVFIRLK